MGAPSPQSGHGQPRNWTRQNWTRNTKLDAPRPTRICVSNFAFSDPKSDSIFGIIGRVKTDTECDLKKIGRNPIFRQCVHFFILVSFSSIKNWTRALSKIGRAKKMDAGLKKRKLDAPFWARKDDISDLKTGRTFLENWTCILSKNGHASDHWVRGNWTQAGHWMLCSRTHETLDASRNWACRGFLAVKIGHARTRNWTPREQNKQ